MLPPTPDLAARQVIVAAYCYYVLDNPVMDDGEYDKLSVVAADNWSELHKDRQWALGDPESTRAGGSHIKFSMRAVCAAHDKLERMGRTAKPFEHRWRRAKGIGRYVTALA